MDRRQLRCAWDAEGSKGKEECNESDSNPAIVLAVIVLGIIIYAGKEEIQLVERPARPYDF